MQADFNRLIAQAQSPGKEERDQAESALFGLCNSDPASVFSSLLHIACSDTLPLSSRQFALLSLRKFITMYWSAGFESYRGPPGVGEEVKSVVRTALLRLCLDSSQDNKIKNGCSYCIVQIAAVDYPDEWPDLLSKVYDSILKQCSLNALSLLNEIFDDIVTEEMFFRGGVGSQTVQIVLRLLSTSSASLETKTAAIKLHKACLLQLQSPEASSTTDHKRALSSHIKESISLLLSLLRNCANQVTSASTNLAFIQFKASIYENLLLLKTGFPKKLFSAENLMKLNRQLIDDLECTCSFFFAQGSSFEESLRIAINELGIHIISLLSDFHDFISNESDQQKIIDSLVRGSSLNNDEDTDWMDDYNTFVTKETGLAAVYYIRDECEQFLLNLDGANYTSMLKYCVSAIANFDENNWKIQESITFVLQALCSNEGEDVDLDTDAVLQLLQYFKLKLASSELHQLVNVRILLAFPKILERFMDSIEDVRILAKELITSSLEYARRSSQEIIKVSALIALTYYASFVELDSVLGIDKFRDTELAVVLLIEEILETSEDDTPAFLLEALSNISSSKSNAGSDLDQRTLRLVLKISAKDPSNIQVVIAGQECLENLLEGVTSDIYVQFADICIPLFVNVLKESIASGFAYSPILSLSLELLTAFIKKKPSEGHLPSNVTEYVFQPLSAILINSQDDEILQITTDTMTFLINNSGADVIAPFLPITLSVLEKLLSVDTSDSAAMNVGLLIVTILEKFSSNLQDVTPKILEAATRRLIDVQNIATTENLIFIFCYLTSIDPKQTVDFLCWLKVQDQNCTALELVLPKWLTAFEVIRGERRIKDNILALSKLFFLNDMRVANLSVNGDLIPYTGDMIITRSMAKNMPPKYTQISAYDKIVKLFITELSFQVTQPDRNDYSSSSHQTDVVTNSTNDGEDDDDWEDVDDVLDYAKLQNYVDDDSSVEDDNDEIVINHELQQTTRELLIQFFKEAAAKNVSNFSDIYDRLTENEKKILSETLV